MRTIFISSVQKEFEKEREELKTYIESDTLLSRFFSVFLFEKTSARSKSAERIYLEEVEKCDIYLCLIGQEYGYVGDDGISPTQKEFYAAESSDKTILAFVKESEKREPKEAAFLKEIDSKFARKKFRDIADLKAQVCVSLIGYLEDEGLVSTEPFEMRSSKLNELSLISRKAVLDFIRKAKEKRGIVLKASDSTEKILTHLGLLKGDKLTNAAILLFGKNPQSLFLQSELKCVRFYGTEVVKPIPDMKFYSGNLFELIDQAVEFVMSKLESGVGSRDDGVASQGLIHEIPPKVILEAISNAVAHRDYASNGSVQAMVFLDRILVINPGGLPSGLSKSMLFKPHDSIPRNPLIAKALFWAGYIESLGSGFLDMKDACKGQGLPVPSVEIDGSFFTLNIKRPDKGNAAKAPIKGPIKGLIKGPIKLSEGQNKVLNLIAEHEGENKTTLLKYSKMTSGSLRRYIDHLHRKEMIEFKGSKKTGGYYIKRKQL